MHRRFCFLLSVISFLTINSTMAIAASRQAENEVRLAGTWIASLQTPGGPIEFELRIGRQGNDWSATVFNPLESVNVPEVRLQDNMLTLAFPHYDSAIQAALKDGVLVGDWKKQRYGNRVDTMKFFAKRGVVTPVKSENYQAFAGRWRVQFSDSSDLAVGQFQHDTKGAWGTFLTTTGDYRFLQAQSCDGDSCQLSCFDGSHAFLFRMKKLADQSLRGDFWSGGSWHETWTAIADDNAKLPDAFQQTTVLRNVSLNDLSFPDLNGSDRKLSDSEFTGDCRMIQIFGSWCPNCHDAALYLNSLQEKYQNRGLRIVGLAFEHTGDFSRDVQQVRRYIKRHKTAYPVLLAGTSDKATATQQLKLVDKVRSYPTTLFLNSAGEVKAVYTGFSGPATGQAYKDLQQRFEQTIERILSE